MKKLLMNVVCCIRDRRFTRFVAGGSKIVPLNDYTSHEKRSINEYSRELGLLKVYLLKGANVLFIKI